MKIAFRADASVDTGTGHVMRCLTLAETLRDRKADVAFLSRQQPGDLCDLVEGKGFRVVRLAPLPAWDMLRDADDTRSALGAFGGPVSWLIVDHYGIDRRWEERLLSAVDRIMVIDDLADRPHACSVLLDQNLVDNGDRRYEGLAPEGCTKLLGPRFALLRREFREELSMLRSRDGSVKRILVFLGGADRTNETGKALEALRLLGRPDIAVDVVTGSSNPHKDTLRDICGRLPWASFHEQVTHMARIMNNADLAIGAGGTATWERCTLGLPSISLIVADNQQAVTEAVAAAGATVSLGRAADIDARCLSEAIRSLVNDPVACSSLERAARALMSGAGGAAEVADLLIGFDRSCGDFRLRPVRESDRDVLLRWRNSARIRRVMFSDHVIAPEEHAAWFAKRLGEYPSRIMVLEYRTRPLGLVTVDRVDAATASCHWGFYLGEEDSPSGSGLALGYLGLDFLFERCGMQTVYGECFAFNEQGVRFHLTMGFVASDGVVRQQMKDGKDEDVLGFSLVRGDWLSKKRQLERLCLGEEHQP